MVHNLHQQSSHHLPRSGVLNNVASSPHYPQSNGKAENAVKTVKRLFTKCQESGQSEFLALMDWRNTPTKGLGTYQSSAEVSWSSM